MGGEEKLPWELIEETLSRVPPRSLVRFRTVCKRWEVLLDEKRFINNHKSTFRFILTTNSKIYSVSIDPEVVVHELTLDIPGLELTLDIPGLEEPRILKHVDVCDEFVLCRMDKGAVVWNPWLNQTRLINADDSQPSLQITGIGYAINNNNGRVRVGYKAIGSYNKEPPNTVWKIHDFASDAWKENIELNSSSSGGGSSSSSTKSGIAQTATGVSLNGRLYWVVYYDKADPFYCLYNFDFSSERFYAFCDLPCGVTHDYDALVLRVFKGDRFSLLKQCHETKKIEIWVTKNKINHEDSGDVVWISFMTFSVPNLPCLVQLRGSYIQPSYFLEDKRLVVCSCDENGQAWIYVLGEDKLISKVKIDSEVDPWPLHCTYFPSLTPVPPPCQREEAESNV